MEGKYNITVFAAYAKFTLSRSRYPFSNLISDYETAEFIPLFQLTIIPQNSTELIESRIV